jgi:23S rRNA (adenine2030-N6)-methyltransferase
MNYRHAFHAGNFADVVKHAVLALVIEALKGKDKPFAVLDTHAGIGSYDLMAEAARKTGEAVAGILKVLAAPAPPAEMAPYLAAIADLNGGRTDPGIRWYPGSPRVTRALLRRHDRLVAAELHPKEHERLAAEFAGDPQVKVHRLDGYQALKAFLPPNERRGLVLVDPPFEEKDEFARLGRALVHGYRRWASGIFLLWYPIKDREPVAAFHRAASETGIHRILRAEVLLHPADDPARLNGTGLLIVNPPWRLPEILGHLLPWLHRTLDGTGGVEIDWLVPE